MSVISYNSDDSNDDQNFTYDPFGNITKTVPGGSTGGSFQPTYSTSTNRYTALPGFTPSYDSNGNLLNDSYHTYTWDAENSALSMDGTGVGLTYDALGRIVEQSRGSAYTEILYGPGGGKLALMSGQTLTKAFVPLPGGPMAVYTTSTSPAYYRHADWLGSSRVSTTGSRGLNYDTAYAPFGEDYAQKTGSGGTADLSFTAQNQDTESGGGSNGQYDFLFRQYSAAQGRWISPDPAGTAVVDPANPQSWNRYGYVDDNPLSAVDPLGLCGGTWTLWSTSSDGTLNVISDVPCGSWWTLVLQGLPLDVFCGITGSCSSSPPTSSGGGSGGGGGGGNPAPPANHSKPSKTGCFLRGAAVGAGGALVVGGLAVGAVALGAPAAAVTGVLLVAGGIGGSSTLYSAGTNIANGNYTGAAYDVGTLGGGVAAGALIGGVVGDSINPPATRGWSFGRDLANRYNPALGSVPSWLGTGPDAAAAGGSTGASGSGLARFLSLLKGGC